MIQVVAVIIAIFTYLFSITSFAGSTFGSRLCKSDPQFTCYKVKPKETWATLFPDEEQRNVIMKINRTNNRIHSGTILAIPTLQIGALMDYSPFNRQIEAPGEKLIMVSLDKLAWGAYDAQGSLVNWGPISGGKGYCPDLGRGCRTATGKFEVYTKQGAGCVSTKFPIGRGGAPMPYCMFFHRGFALHGSYDIPGYNASHGCVRMFVTDAKWLNQEFVGQEHVPVIVQKF